jgi:hypothetical protein
MIILMSIEEKLPHLVTTKKRTNGGMHTDTHTYTHRAHGEPHTQVSKPDHKRSRCHIYYWGYNIQHERLGGKNPS